MGSISQVPIRFSYEIDNTYIKNQEDAFQARSISIGRSYVRESPQESYTGRICRFGDGGIDTVLRWGLILITGIIPVLLITTIIDKVLMISSKEQEEIKSEIELAAEEIIRLPESAEKEYITNLLLLSGHELECISPKIDRIREVIKITLLFSEIHQNKKALYYQEKEEVKTYTQLINLLFPLVPDANSQRAQFKDAPTIAEKKLQFRNFIQSCNTAILNVYMHTESEELEATLFEIQRLLGSILTTIDGGIDEKIIENLSILMQKPIVSDVGGINEKMNWLKVVSFEETLLPDRFKTTLSQYKDALHTIGSRESIDRITAMEHPNSIYNAIFCLMPIISHWEDENDRQAFWELFDQCAQRLCQKDASFDITTIVDTFPSISIQAITQDKEINPKDIIILDQIADYYEQLCVSADQSIDSNTRYGYFELIGFVLSVIQKTGPDSKATIEYMRVLLQQIN